MGGTENPCPSGLPLPGAWARTEAESCLLEKGRSEAAEILAGWERGDGRRKEGRGRAFWSVRGHRSGLARKDTRIDHSLGPCLPLLSARPSPFNSSPSPQMWPGGS